MPTQNAFSTHGPAGNIEGVAHLPDGEPNAIAIVAHPLPTMGGTMENKVVTTLAKTFMELGFAALRFNFRGVGNSEGKFDNGNGEVDDVLAVVNYAKENFGHLPLVLSGFSFGGYVQARVAQLLLPHPDRLVLIAPAVGRSVPGLEKSTGMPNVRNDTILIHGEQDEVVPLAEVQAWAKPQQLAITILPETGHFFHGRLNDLKQIVQQSFTGAK